MIKRLIIITIALVLGILMDMYGQVKFKPDPIYKGYMYLDHIAKDTSIISSDITHFKMMFNGQEVYLSNNYKDLSNQLVVNCYDCLKKEYGKKLIVTILYYIAGKELKYSYYVIL